MIGWYIGNSFGSGIYVSITLSCIIVHILEQKTLVNHYISFPLVNKQTCACVYMYLSSYPLNPMYVHPSFGRGWGRTKNNYLSNTHTQPPNALRNHFLG